MSASGISQWPRSANQIQSQCVGLRRYSHRSFSASIVHLELTCPFIHNICYFDHRNNFRNVILTYAFTHKIRQKDAWKCWSVYVCVSFLTFSSVETVSLSLAIRLHTCCSESPRNSSPCTTSVKCCSERHRYAGVTNQTNQNCFT